MTARIQNLKQNRSVPDHRLRGEDGYGGSSAFLNYGAIVPTLVTALLLAAVACDVPPTEHVPEPPVHPSLMVRPEHKAVILARLDREPYLTLLARVQGNAEREYQEDDPEHWSSGPNGENGKAAQANAFLAWLFDDEAAAVKARDFFSRLLTHFETNAVLDVNIRMPHVLMTYTDAWDLLLATPWFPEDEATRAASKLCEITGKFYDRYVEDDAMRTLLLGTTQNNHPIRTAAAIGYVAMAFPDHPDAPAWADWAVSELDYLWGPTGHYIQPDGGVSEGPFYYSFAWGVSAAFFIAFDNHYAESPVFRRDCRNRVIMPPWNDHDCVEGEEFQLENPLYAPRFLSAVDWNLSLRLPFGPRPPLGDANYIAFNGSALLSGFGADGRYRWDWEGNRDDPYATTWGAELTPHHLAYFDDAVEAVEPPWTSRFLPQAGNAVFRSDWSDDARWGLLVAEHGDVRKTVHDHVDGTSFTLAAYGEYLLIDTGYYKPDAGDNAVTCNSPSHNVVLIDGIAAPDKGLLNNFRDADAWLLNTWDGERIEYAEAHQGYQDATVVRAVVFVEGRYFVVGDRVDTDVTEPRVHTYRMHGYAGYDVGGTFTLRQDGARWERALAGVDVYVSSTATGLSAAEPPFVEWQAPHVHQFDWSRNQEHHAVLDASVLAREPGFLSLLLPYRVGGEATPSEQPLPATKLDLGSGVTAWTVEHVDTVDLALLRSPQAAQSFSLPGGQLLETDGLFVVIRLSGPSPFAVLSRGTHVTLDGAALVTSASVDTVAVSED
ncbi:MAG: heparinase II/III family protein [bacterium]